MFFSIIIPTHGSITLLQKCIKSLRKYEKGNNYEVIIVDDGSHIKDRALLENYCRTETLRVICNRENKGFAHAVNTGISKARLDTGIYLLCNNDIIFTNPVLTPLTQSFNNHLDTAIIGARLSYPNKTIQHAGMHYSAHAQAFLHTYKNFKENLLSVNRKNYCIAVTGALFAIRATAHKDLGTFNEDYFLACEDTEYCLRAWTRGFNVLYDPTIKAIHLEGGTRGKNAKAKLKANHVWARGEAESIAKFKKHLEVYDLASISNTIDSLNRAKPIKEPTMQTPFKTRKKIEVGSGFSPHPGYLHLDVRKGLPQLDYVCDFSKERLPFKDGEVEEILANHVIEHISFRKLSFVLGEWSRVLGADGKLILRTPNLRFIVEKYLAGETTPEWPGDEAYITNYLSKEVTPAWWANIKLFSGQDYAANFHHVCFDFPMLKELLERFGFKTVLEVKFDRTFSPGELQVEAYKNVVMKVVMVSGAEFVLTDALTGEVTNVTDTPAKKTALVIRKHAFGDVLMTTPIVKRLFDEGYEVNVQTGGECIDALKNNPFVHQIQLRHSSVVASDLTAYYDKVIDLDLAYENNPKMHVIDAYSLVAFGDTETEHKLYFYTSDDSKFISGIPRQFLYPTVIHPGVGWENRTWGSINWTDLVERIEGKIILIGARSDSHVMDGANPDKVLDLIGKLTWNQTALIMKQAKLFIGPDSAPLHLAQALGTKSIGLFTCAKAEYRTTGALAVIPNIDCYGCLHDETPPVTYCGCRRGDFKCLELITPESVMEVVRRV